MHYDLETGNFQVVLESADIHTVVGESATIEIGQAIQYIKSGEAEIADAVEAGKVVIEEKVKEADEAAAKAAEVAHNNKFGIYRHKINSTDWQSAEDGYTLTYEYNVVAAVYKAVGETYELVTNINVTTQENKVIIHSQEAFDGYVLLANSAQPTTFIYEQATASDTWPITHNLERFPSVTIVDSAGNIFYPAVQYVDANHCLVTMNGETTGKAYLN